jgi:hypothetical protein
MKNDIITEKAIAIVAADKNDGSPFIWVFLKDDLPFHQGAITSDVAEITVNAADAFGEGYSTTRYKGAAVKARWIGKDNVLTAPNVRKGDRVLVFSTGDDIAYWDTYGNDTRTFKTEKKVYAWAADGSDHTEDNVLTSANAYTLEIDTDNGHVTFRTSHANKEKATFTMQFDTRNGICTLNDNKPNANTIQLNSVTDTITLKNGYGTFIALDKDKIRIHGEIITDSVITGPLFSGPDHDG